MFGSAPWEPIPLTFSIHTYIRCVFCFVGSKAGDEIVSSGDLNVICRMRKLSYAFRWTSFSNLFNRSEYDDYEDDDDDDVGDHHYHHHPDYNYCQAYLKFETNIWQNNYYVVRDIDWHQRRRICHIRAGMQLFHAVPFFLRLSVIAGFLHSVIWAFLPIAFCWHFFLVLSFFILFAFPPSITFCRQSFIILPVNFSTKPWFRQLFLSTIWLLYYINFFFFCFLHIAFFIFCT